jgi:hypothetical protein
VAATIDFLVLRELAVGGSGDVTAPARHPRAGKDLSALGQSPG